MTPAYLSERLSDGYKYAYEHEFAYETEERGAEEMARALLGDRSALEETVEVLGAQWPQELLESAAWYYLRTQWKRAKVEARSIPPSASRS